jgi:hypothetical protein
LLQAGERSRPFFVQPLHLAFELPDSPFDHPRIFWRARCIQPALWCYELTFLRHEFAYGILDDPNESLMPTGK